MKKIFTILMLASLLFMTPVQAEANEGDKSVDKQDICYVMRVSNDTGELSEMIASVEAEESEGLEKVDLVVRDENDVVLFEGKLNEFSEQYLGEISMDEIRDMNICLSTDEDVDLEAIDETLNWTVDLEESVSSASVEPEVEEIKGDYVVPSYPAVDRLGFSPNLSKFGLVVAVGSFATGYFIARRRR